MQRLGRPPEVRYQKSDGVTPRLQRALDALYPIPAVIRTEVWDVVAWNRAATVMLMDYGSLPPEQRNLLRFIFLDPRARAMQYDWKTVARFVLGAFRVDAARARAAAEVGPLIDELSRLSPEFRTMWRENDVHDAHSAAVKHIRHPVLGPLAFEYSVFCGRRADGPQYGGLQSCDARRCRTDQVADRRALRQDSIVEI